MTDDVQMRLRLQLVAAYRELRRGVQKSGRDNVLFAALMFGFAYFLHANGVALNALLFYGLLIAGELVIGLVKWLFPSAECLLLDVLVLLAFAGYNFWHQFQRVQLGGPPNTTGILFGLLFLWFAFGRVQNYLALRKLFAERPTAEQIAWFDELVYEIRASAPEIDPLALDLPTRPYYKAKLIGTTAFFVAVRGPGVWVAGPDDFTLLRAKTDPGTGRRKALLRVYGNEFPEFEIDDASWANYTRWLAGLDRPPAPAE